MTEPRCAWSGDAGELLTVATGSRVVCDQTKDAANHQHSMLCPVDGHEQELICHAFVEAKSEPARSSATVDALERVMATAAGPGSRRFRDLLRLERDDVAMLWGHVAQLYDYVSGGRISKGNTYPFEVIALYEEGLQRDVDEGVAEALADLAGLDGAWVELDRALPDHDDEREVILVWHPTGPCEATTIWSSDVDDPDMLTARADSLPEAIRDLAAALAARADGQP